MAANQIRFDFDFFLTWSPNLAWLLGYTWSDGSISTRAAGGWFVRYCCAKSDEQILRDIQQAVRHTGALRYHTPAGSKQPRDGRLAIVSQEQTWFKLHSKALVELFINEYGIPCNKSNIDPPFPKVPDEWLSHFVRGVLDGDGTICQHVCRKKYTTRIVQFLGTHRFLETLRDRVSALARVSHKKFWPSPSSKKISVLHWSAQDDVLALLRWLYPAGEYISLQRKRMLAERFIKELETPKPIQLPVIMVNGAGYAKAYFENIVVALGRADDPERHARHQRLIDAIQQGKRGEELRTAARASVRRHRPRPPHSPIPAQ